MAHEARAVTPPTIRQRLDAARDAEYVSITDAALLLSVSPDTIRRRLPHFNPDKAEILRSGRIIRLRRITLFRLFRVTKSPNPA